MRKPADATKPPEFYHLPFSKIRNLGRKAKNRIPVYEQPIGIKLFPMIEYYLNKFNMHLAYWKKLPGAYMAVEHPTAAAAIMQSAMKWKKHPVMFKPSHEMFMGMANTDATFPLADYQQPFDSVMLEWPDGQSSLVSLLDTTSDRIIFVSHSVDIIRVDGMEGKTNIMIPLSGKVQDGLVVHTVEEGLQNQLRWVGGDHDLDSKTHDLICSYTRAAINCCLMLASHPTHRVRSPRERELQRQTKNPVRAKAAAAHQKIRLMPQVIDFTQKMSFFSSVGSASVAGNRRPHWRRGHWRQQRFGVGRSQQRLLFIKPMLIHADNVLSGNAPIDYIGR